ncbi:FAD-binding domain-containing protein [Nitrospirillum sp. BR 11164]|nr:FAD-binding domain-containing protein [Nitrospirillum sp. BR 11164]MEA1651419.1 FAD-binding domain-containing protein [Nitrospirillum sp. BR 11164]
MESFLRELGWREFSHHLLYHFPFLPERPLNPKFEAFTWDDNAAHLAAWRCGQTGYPIVDAGMRELWATGWMHNRVRMVVGSFLVKHLLLPWTAGQAWFWDTLVDADLANNAASWQWIAGCGADAAPYFRVFNPVLQGEKFDAGGTMCAAGCLSWRACPTACCTSPGRPTPSPCGRPACAWATTTLTRWWTTRRRGSGRWTPSRRSRTTTIDLWG